MTHANKKSLAGFLNAMDNNVEDCPAWSICEASREAGGRGKVGGVVARFWVSRVFFGKIMLEADILTGNASMCRVSGHQAAQWLKRSKDIERAALQVRRSLPWQTCLQILALFLGKYLFANLFSSLANLFSSTPDFTFPDSRAQKEKTVTCSSNAHPFHNTTGFNCYHVCVMDLLISLLHNNPTT